MKCNLTQCGKCPWRKDVDPHDIPDGYCERKHAELKDAIADPGYIDLLGPLRIMACHESSVGKERPCVGWLINQLGPGNNIALRLWARDNIKVAPRTIGEQHERFEDTLP